MSTPLADLARRLRNRERISRSFAGSPSITHTRRHYFLGRAEGLAMAQELLNSFERAAVLNNAEELEALPDGSVVLDCDGDAWQRDGAHWWLACGMERFPVEYLARYSPFRVLHTPTPEGH